MGDRRSIYEYNIVDAQRTGPECITYFVPIYEGGRVVKTPEAKILFEKQLKRGDRGSLSIKHAFESGKLKMDVLKEEEKMKLRREGFLMLLTKDPDGTSYNLQFKYNGNANISEDWFDIYMENNLKVGDYVTGWGYRTDDGELCIAISFPK